MTNENLFSAIEPEEPSEILSPSEQFALEHPSFVQPPVPERIIDPNARQANRQRDLGLGGGIADALDGDIRFVKDNITNQITSDSVSPVSPTRQTTTSSRKKRPLIEPRSGDSERDTGEPLYYGPPQLPTPEQKTIGKTAIQAMQDDGTIRNTRGRGPGN